MIAHCGTYSRTTTAGTTTPNTYSATNDTDGWYEAVTRQTVEVVSEPQQQADDEQVEDTGWRESVNTRLPNRRPATVTGRTPDRPRQQASGFG